MNIQEKEASERVMQWLTANWINQPLYVVTKLGIPDIVADSSLTAEQLAEITGTHYPYLYRVMRTLASMGLFCESERGEFSLSAMGEVLREGKMRSIILMFLSPWHNRAWEQLFHSVQTGDIPFESAFGKSAFEWFSENRSEAEIFNKANQIKARAAHTAILKNYDFSPFKDIADVGGGYGGLLLSLLESRPELKGSIADLPYMKEQVTKRIESLKLNGRCSYNECNFFEAIPEGYDCYILSNILHDWNDKKCREILDKCSSSMGDKGVLLIIESIIAGPNEFSVSKLLDMEVLVMGGGKERTEEEYRALLASSGFTLSRIVATEENLSLMECKKLTI